MHYPALRRGLESSYHGAVQSVSRMHEPYLSDGSRIVSSARASKALDKIGYTCA